MTHIELTGCMLAQGNIECMLSAVFSQSMLSSLCSVLHYELIKPKHRCQILITDNA